MKKIPVLIAASLILVVFLPKGVRAADYVIDTKKAHAFIQFKISHLGYSWLYGRFNRFEGSFSYDESEPTESKVRVTIDMASVDTNHAERDKHLRGKDFFEVKKYPKATFTSTSFTRRGKDKAIMKGDLTMHGVTREVVVEVSQIGAGKDPWGGFRRGFEGRTTLSLADFDIRKNLGPSSKEVELFLSIEGIRKK